ncbi:hypothetical protein GDO81_017685 [Engystomops pustulosus]|uniref:Uncharacterized protein n=1 Tax=Engystomops pustulosus TaxID=76066 RepID=A0AAV7A3W8_ENGPU|nr:hypothetical protein GDO81_017685 [Engystomops pustulosus]
MWCGVLMPRTIPNPPESSPLPSATYLRGARTGRDGATAGTQRSGSAMSNTFTLLPSSPGSEPCIRLVGEGCSRDGGGAVAERIEFFSLSDNALYFLRPFPLCNVSCNMQVHLSFWTFYSYLWLKIW